MQEAKTSDRVHSAAGDSRERPVPCRACRRETINYRAICDVCCAVAP
jgi:hypothetical protein